MQNNKQSSLNTGFPNVEDFIEPEFSEADQASTVLQRENPHPFLDSPPIAITLNNVITLVSVAVTFAIAVVTFNMHVALVPNDGISFAGLFYSVPIALLVYLFSGFLLRPLPKYNFLSVSLLPLLFAASMLHADWHHYSSFAAYMEHRSILNFIPPFVPSSLMYLGLRLKMRGKQKACDL